MYLGIDIGGTKTFVAALDDNGVIKQRLKIPTDKDYKVFIRKLSDTVGYITTKKFIAAGVAAPGIIDHKNGVGVAMGNLPWENAPIQADVARIAHAPAILENDAKLAGLSEAMLIKDRYDKVLYAGIGTGIGVGVIINQKIDPALMDCEAGHMLLEYNGKLQKWEDFAGGRGIIKRFGKKAQDIAGDEEWKEIAHNLALGFIDLFAVIKPQVVIIGGGVGVHFRFFREPLIAELKSYETPMVPVPPIIEAQRPENAVLYGCYDLAKMTHGKTHS